LEIHEQELFLLRKAAEQNWSKVQPEIFGTLFQHSMEIPEWAGRPTESELQISPFA